MVWCRSLYLCKGVWELRVFYVNVSGLLMDGFYGLRNCYWNFCWSGKLLCNYLDEWWLNDENFFWGIWCDWLELYFLSLVLFVWIDVCLWSFV